MAKRSRSDLTQAEVKELLRYEADTGLFYWLVERGSIQLGQVAGWRSGKAPNIYIIITINGYYYRAHRLAWFYVHGRWPLDQIDHIDGSGVNNCIGNLREATCSENLRNMRLTCRNTSGVKGVFWDKERNAWLVRIRSNGRYRHVGRFANLACAATAYRDAAAREYGEFARFE